VVPNGEPPFLDLYRRPSCVILVVSSVAMSLKDSLVLIYQCTHQSTLRESVHRGCASLILNVYPVDGRLTTLSRLLGRLFRSSGSLWGALVQARAQRPWGFLPGDHFLLNQVI
jgi:hypothetical protein